MDFDLDAKSLLTKQSTKLLNTDPDPQHGSQHQEGVVRKRWKMFAIAAIPGGLSNS